MENSAIVLLSSKHKNGSLITILKLTN